MQLLTAREVPLGGLRALMVRRTLPHRNRSFIGAWCFVDHYGPDRIAADGSGGMDVAPHPHTGLQTVSWLFEGEIEHRDSAGFHAFVRPQEVNLMTAGHGIAHSEVSTPATRVLHGVQLWVALPESARDGERTFEHYAAPGSPLPDDAGVAYVFLGHLHGVAESPVATHTPLLGAQLDLAPGARLTLALDPTYEHGILLDAGDVAITQAVPAGEAPTGGGGRTSHHELSFGDMACFDPGRNHLTLTSSGGARLILLGGPPFEEEIVMWWNFVGRSHEDIVAAREQWEAGSDRYGAVPGYAGPRPRIPAPAPPGARLRPRGRRGVR